ncbi:MICOS complex subunit mic25 isoform X1 [Latimeria chalumnae]|uniref:MICOS complex subunit mic25 isoform X1 n=1 Tax=Latimeria chalumnae TaxID=7897 RepID=UPI00313CE54A
MGGAGSRGRSVSFGRDEEERIRVLRGVRLSEDVVNRMKESSSVWGESKPHVMDTGPQRPTREKSPHVGTAEDRSHQEDHPDHQPTEAEEDLYKRFEREQAMVQEELERLARLERRATSENPNLALLREQAMTDQERQRTKQLAKQLQKKELDLKQLGAFYKEQLGLLQKKNAELYKMSTQQLHDAATTAETHVKRRIYEPVCARLQSEILRCYREKGDHTLSCADLAKEYRGCVQTAQKVVGIHFKNHRLQISCEAF